MRQTALDPAVLERDDVATPACLADDAAGCVAGDHQVAARAGARLFQDGVLVAADELHCVACRARDQGFRDRQAAFEQTLRRGDFVAAQLVGAQTVDRGGSGKQDAQQFRRSARQGVGRVVRRFEGQDVEVADTCGACGDRVFDRERSCLEALAGEGAAQVVDCGRDEWSRRGPVDAGNCARLCFRAPRWGDIVPPGDQEKNSAALPPSTFTSRMTLSL